ncbi:hypothetical protein [Heyndrickxia sp. FSL W8-0423]|uniref:hypothetical protein n=1 Tax=Heyndrickxia sp. FSL W8-0423 TaxID=2921601 RepID=UPI0030F9F507
MSFFEDEILNDLKVGEIYTEREITSIIYFKDNVVILCQESSQFHSSNTETKYKVLDRTETFVHTRDARSQSYILPNEKTIIYKIERIY